MRPHHHNVRESSRILANIADLVARDGDTADSSPSAKTSMENSTVEPSLRQLRFGVVGCGAISTLYQLPALQRSACVQLVAAVDLDHAWARTVAQRFQIAEFYNDYQALIGRVDAVLIATPNTTHANMACMFLEHGIHVLCEKPLATSRADVERMFAASAQTGARLMAAHCYRFSPNFAMLKRLISAGWLGTVQEISAGIGGVYSAGAQRTNFRQQRRLSGGGVLIDLGVHLIDLALWLTGQAPIEVLYHSGSTPGWEVENTAEVALAFADASHATLSCSFTQVLNDNFVVRGDGGWAYAPLYTPTRCTVFSKQARICQKNGLQHIVLPDISMYDLQLQHFCSVVLEGDDCMIQPHEVLSSLAIIEQCYSRGSNA